jgi:hypothetical protein
MRQLRKSQLEPAQAHITLVSEKQQLLQFAKTAADWFW